MLASVSLFLALLGAASAPAADVPVPDSAAWLVERVQTHHAVAEGGAVSVANPWGNVIVRAGDEGDLMVLSLAQRHRDDPRTAEVAVVEEEGGTAVRVGYPQVALPEPVEEWERRRVDLTVLVPPGSPLSVETADGDVEAKGLREPLRVDTRRGDVRILTGGPVDAVSEHGEIDVHFLSMGWPGRSRLVTTTGPIVAELPAGGAAEVRFRTSGPLTTDYSVAIDRDPASSLKSGTATIGAGGPRLEIESDRGPITLMASLVPEGSAAGEVD